MSRALAKSWATSVDRAARPYQFALQARAGTDALAAHVVCCGLPLWHGAQLAVDANLVSPLAQDRRPHFGTEAQPGIAVRAAARRKRRQTYLELDRQAMPLGGAWARSGTGYSRGWWALGRRRCLAVAAQRALAATFLELQTEPCGAPALHELLADARRQAGPQPSHVPADRSCGFSVPKTSPAQALKQGALAVAVVAWAGWDKLKL